MAIFAIMLPSSQPRVVAEIQQKFALDHFKITDDQWLISANATVADIAAKLGIYDPSRPNEATGLAVIVAVSSYSGRAQNTIWEWLKVKMETPPSTASG